VLEEDSAQLLHHMCNRIHNDRFRSLAAGRALPVVGGRGGRGLHVVQDVEGVEKVHVVDGAGGLLIHPRGKVQQHLQRREARFVQQGWGGLGNR